MKITVLFFASLREAVGSSRVEFDLPEGLSVDSLKDHISKDDSALKILLAGCIAAINRQFVCGGDTVPPGAEVAFFPPVSGGSMDCPTLVKVTYDALDLNALTAELTRATTGGVCCFTGVVRGMTKRDGKTTSHLEYEAYIPMAEEKLGQIAAEIRQRWASIEGIAIVQRIGLLEPGTPSVAVVCAAEHRDTGIFEAARYGIDRLKEIVPIWKKEVGQNGDVWIEGEYFPHAGE